jgi:hypothetical protein
MLVSCPFLWVKSRRVRIGFAAFVLGSGAWPPFGSRRLRPPCLWAPLQFRNLNSRVLHLPDSTIP